MIYLELTREEAIAAVGGEEAYAAILERMRVIIPDPDAWTPGRQAMVTLNLAYWLNPALPPCSWERKRPPRPATARSKGPRSGVTDKVRFAVLRRDAFRCRYCGAQPARSALVVDHVVPISCGGGDEPENLVAACIPCNSGKAATAVENVPPGPEETSEL